MSTAKGNGRNSRKAAPAKTHKNNADDFTTRVARFTGTDNPRHLRVIQALMARPRLREDVDAIAQCSNGPDLVSDLRFLGLDVPCERIKFIDCDGRICRPGVYSFTANDRRLIWAWMTRVKKGSDGKRA